VQWALAGVCILLMALGIWSVLRVRATQAELERLRAASDQRATQLTQQLAQARTDREAIRTDLDRLRQKLAAGSAASHVLIPLAPVTTRLASGPERRIRIPSGTDVVDLQLGLPAGRRHRAYRALLRGWSDGEEVWSQGRLEPGDGTLVLYLPAGVLRPGPYELALSAASGGAREDVAFYEFAIEKGR
jgi:hypothetical protein